MFDATDLEPAAFFGALLEGLGSHAPYAGKALVGALQASSPAEVLASAFLVELEAACLPGLLVVIDDVHHLSTGHPIAAAIAFMLPRLPPAVVMALDGGAAGRGHFGGEGAEAWAVPHGVGDARGLPGP